MICAPYIKVNIPNTICRTNKKPITIVEKYKFFIFFLKTLIRIYT